MINVTAVLCALIPQPSIYILLAIICDVMVMGQKTSLHVCLSLKVCFCSSVKQPLLWHVLSHLTMSSQSDSSSRWRQASVATCYVGTSFSSFLSVHTTVIWCLLWWIWWSHDKLSQENQIQNHIITFIQCLGDRTSFVMLWSSNVKTSARRLSIGSSYPPVIHKWPQTGTSTTQIRWDDHAWGRRSVAF